MDMQCEKKRCSYLTMGGGVNCPDATKEKQKNKKKQSLMIDGAFYYFLQLYTHRNKKVLKNAKTFCTLHTCLLSFCDYFLKLKFRGDIELEAIKRHAFPGQRDGFCL